MKNVLYALGALFLGVCACLSTGCASERNVAFFFFDATGSPVTNVVATTYKPASFFERVFNPIGTFYHPIWPTHTDIPDSKGTISYANIPKGHLIYISIPESTFVQCVFDGRTNIVEKFELKENEQRKELVLDDKGTTIYYELLNSVKGGRNEEEGK